jgi:hypothetical protein
MSSPRLPVLLALLAYCVLSRVPSFKASFDPEVGWYLWNFSPYLAMCVFSGGMYRSWLWAAVAPMATYLLGDIAIWIASGDVTQAFHPASVWTYVALPFVMACGWWLRRGERTWGRIATSSFGASLAFFLITNFGSWVMDPMLPQPTGYARGLAGLVQSYEAALPFWKYELGAVFLFSSLFFSPLGVAALTQDSAAEAEAARGRREELEVAKTRVA